jgi:hypothetical protein
MKKEILWMLLNSKQRMNRSLKKKIIIGLGLISIVAFVCVGIAGVFAYKAGSYLFDKVSALPVDKISSEALKGGQILSKTLSAHTCTSSLSKLLLLETWINKPLSESFNSVTESCFNTHSQLILRDGDKS